VASLAAASAVSHAQTSTATDSARADLPFIRKADAARTRGAGAIDTLCATVHEFIDHACPSCRAFHTAYGDSLKLLAVAQRTNLAIRVAPIPGLLRGAHAAEAAFCAGGLGGAPAFDAMHHSLLDGQSTWRFQRDPLPRLLSMAAETGVDSTAMRE